MEDLVYENLLTKLNNDKLQHIYGQFLEFEKND